MNNFDIFNTVCSDCSQSITKRYTHSFYKAISVLHKDLHEPIYGLYGFVRMADEIVDTFHDHDKEQLLNDFKRDTFEAIERKISINPVLHSFQRVVNRYKIEHRYIEAFFDSMYADLSKKDWTTEKELNDYIYGSAEVVGLMCLQIFCDANPLGFNNLKPYAMAMGSALQKINFLRDLKDDVNGLGRRYFAGVDFDTFDQSKKEEIEQDILNDLNTAYKGVMKLPVHARFGVLLAYRYYKCLFNKIRKMPPDAVAMQRASVPNLQKMMLFIQTSINSRYQFTT